MDEAHRVGPLFLSLLVEVRGQLGQAFVVEVAGNGNVLQRGAKLVPDLLIDGAVHFFAEEHKASWVEGVWGLF